LNVIRSATLHLITFKYSFKTCLHNLLYSTNAAIKWLNSRDKMVKGKIEIGKPRDKMVKGEIEIGKPRDKMLKGSTEIGSRMSDE